MEYIKDSQTILQAQGGDEEALSRIVESNMGLVKNAARRFLGRGTEAEDLIQIGTIGMIKAVRRFDPSLNLSFTTYAVAMILGEIRRYLRDDGLIKVSRTAKNNYRRIGAFCSAFRNEYHCEPTPAQIAEGIGLNQEDVIYALESNQSTVSLFERSEESDRSPADYLGENSIEDRFDAWALEEAIGTLSPQEQLLIRLRFYRQLTQSQTARILGITQVKVSREEKKICQKLKRELSG